MGDSAGQTISTDGAFAHHRCQPRLIVRPRVVCTTLLNKAKMHESRESTVFKCKFFLATATAYFHARI